MPIDINNFREIDGEYIAGMSNPSKEPSSDYDDAEDNVLEKRLEALHEDGFRTIISLEERGAQRIHDVWLKYPGHIWIKSFLPDYSAPCAKQLDYYCDKVKEHARPTNKVVTHCQGGSGRTGCFLAAYLVKKDDTLNAHQAIAKVREEYNLHAVETASQYNALARFSDFLGRDKSARFKDGKSFEPEDAWIIRKYLRGIDDDPGHEGDKPPEGLPEDIFDLEVRPDGRFKKSDSFGEESKSPASAASEPPAPSTDPLDFPREPHTGFPR